MRQGHFQDHRKIDPLRGKELGRDTSSNDKQANTRWLTQNSLATQSSNCQVKQKWHCFCHKR